MRLACLSLGSSDDPENNLPRLVAALRRHFPDLVVSSVYRYPDAKGSPVLYHNAAALCHTDLEPEALIRLLKIIERDLGRDRTSDLVAADVDLLLLGELVRPDLRLPREKDLRERHVFEPLLEIAPTLQMPQGISLVAWLQAHNIPAQQADKSRGIRFP